MHRLVQLGLVVLHAMGKVGLSLVFFRLFGAASTLALEESLEVGARCHFVWLDVVF